MEDQQTQNSGGNAVETITVDANLLRDVTGELRRLRQHSQVMAAKLEGFDIALQLVYAQPPERPMMGAAEDRLWTLEQRIQQHDKQTSAREIMKAAEEMHRRMKPGTSVPIPDGFHISTGAKPEGLTDNATVTVMFGDNSQRTGLVGSFVWERQPLDFDTIVAFRFDKRA